MNKNSKLNPAPNPTFLANSELSRYVDPDHLKNGGRVSSAAFMPNPTDSYLSVNSTAIESLQDIAVYYRSTFTTGMGPVAIACRKVSDYNSAARNADIRISYCKVECKWKYDASTGIKDAYKHRPTRISLSHCGVEYLGNGTDYLTIKKIARRLSGNKPHLFKITK